MLDETTDLDRTFQALADPSRRCMVERLSLGPASVSELARPLAMSLAAVVQHVQVLEACGVVQTEKVGRTRMCRIRPAAMSAAEQWINDRRRGWEVATRPTGRRSERRSPQGAGGSMTQRSATHDTFVIARTYDAPVPASSEPGRTPSESSLVRRLRRRAWATDTSSTSGWEGTRSIAADPQVGRCTRMPPTSETSSMVSGSSTPTRCMPTRT